jgi:hypothetical protein
MKKIVCLYILVFAILSSNAQDKMTNKMDRMDYKMGKMKNSRMKECLMMTAGKMMVYKDGKINMMESEMALSNGIMVNTDGTVKLKNGETTILKNGESIDMNGQIMHRKMKKVMNGSKM